ncbi:hypothetical protein FEMY_24290 [Ferrovum myxofaciens]|uniref:Uncharacterized protein n=1 Tax=Ferrovum myxofaciens TaxID=416213 RepID=A0A149VV03_9PROT|nr:hypothetical protein FEMY_24290 [Ferrovum myxofaciens]
MPPLRFFIALDITLKIGVGQVIQGYRLIQTKKRLDSRKDMVFNDLAVLHQYIRSVVQACVWHGFKIEVDQLAQRTVLLQPVPCRQLRCRFGHASDYIAQNRRAHDTIDPQFAQFLDKAELRQGI